jgi:hypothetical protein
MGRSYTGSKCLLVISVSGLRRVPNPPAKMTPLIFFAMDNIPP